jgi:hypothetical protein
MTAVMIVAPWVRLALPFGVMTAALSLAWMQSRQRRFREEDLSPEDAEYFSRQDRRRFIGAAVMALLAIGVAVGLSDNFPRNREGGRLFGATWLANSALALGLLAIAMFDWRANFRYAHRQIARLQAERKALMDELRARFPEVPPQRFD